MAKIKIIRKLLLLKNKDLLRKQLLSSCKKRAEKAKQPKSKHQRNRQKNRWKLKFHHQALPQEYLDHYEQSLQKVNVRAEHHKQKQVKNQKHKPYIDINNITKEKLNNWTHSLASVHNENDTRTAPPVLNLLNKSYKANDKKKNKPELAPSKIATYDDLPFMGEMTLNNSKPRRGRKPKKADICHLIYQNYGTVLPSQTVPYHGRLNQLTFCSSLRIKNSVGTAKIDLQNRIITSLLERKLLHEDKKRLGIMARYNNTKESIPAAPVTVAGPLVSDDEPLNLCIRDLKIQLQRKFGNIYLSMPRINTEIVVDTKMESTKNKQLNAISVKQKNTNVSVSVATPRNLPELYRVLMCSDAGSLVSNTAASAYSLAADGKFPRYVFWPSTGLYIHPLWLSSHLLYYQQLAAADQMLVAPQHKKEKVFTLNTTNGINSTATNSPLLEDVKNIVLNHLSELIDPKVTKQVQDSEPSPDQVKIKRSSRNSTVSSVKKKRSKILIPPMPLNSNSKTPMTEVSICKFKFTGGSKPSLQEKKRLSVELGGNFRYYSGTGNKGNKAYEKGQNESNPSRSSEVTPKPFMSMTSKAKNQSTTVLKDELSNKTRKSRKSLEREKLEQAFKERGFLIQTQQLQSAEGATYCKFRQLRKFSRYLFRSWKDYLPGELEEHIVSPESTAEGAAVAETRSVSSGSK